MTTNVTYRDAGAVIPTSTTVKGAPLSNAEIDGNFKSLVDSVNAMVDSVDAMVDSTDLAAPSGAALVGADTGLTYAAGTVGAMLKSLQGSITALSGQIAGILDGATFTGPISLPGNAVDNLHAVPLVQAMQIAADAATGAAVGRLLRIERFKVSGTFTKQPGDRLIHAMLVGGGGGGLGAGGTGGGGAGGAAFKLFNAADLNASEVVTVGAGGAVNTGGGNSSFMGVTAFGGDSGISGGSGMGGGYATGGDLNIAGGGGGSGIPAGQMNTAALRMFGGGGCSIMGGGAPGWIGETDIARHAPHNTGGGAGGTGTGGSGYVELRVYS